MPLWMRNALSLLSIGLNFTTRFPIAKYTNPHLLGWHTYPPYRNCDRTGRVSIRNRDKSRKMSGHPHFPFFISLPVEMCKISDAWHGSVISDSERRHNWHGRIGRGCATPRRRLRHFAKMVTGRLLRKNYETFGGLDLGKTSFRVGRKLSSRCEQNWDNSK